MLIHGHIIIIKTNCSGVVCSVSIYCATNMFAIVPRRQNSHFFVWSSKLKVHHQIRFIYSCPCDAKLILSRIPQIQNNRLLHFIIKLALIRLGITCVITQKNETPSVCRLLSSSMSKYKRSRNGNAVTCMAIRIDKRIGN